MEKRRDETTEETLSRKRLKEGRFRERTRGGSTVGEVE